MLFGHLIGCRYHQTGPDLVVHDVPDHGAMLGSTVALDILFIISPIAGSQLIICVALLSPALPSS